MKIWLIYFASLLLSMGVIESPCHFQIVEKESAPYIEEMHINIPISFENGISEEIEPALESRFTEEEKQLLAQLVQAEAGNQDLIGMRLVIDVVINRVQDPRFPDTVEDVIFEPYQFSVILDGSFDRAGSCISEQAWEAVELESYEQIDSGILYFSAEPANGSGFWMHGDHWFSY